MITDGRNQQDREDFEEWWETQGIATDSSLGAAAFKEMAWRGWQAALALAAYRNME